MNIKKNMLDFEKRVINMANITYPYGCPFPQIPYNVLSKPEREKLAGEIPKEMRGIMFD